MRDTILIGSRASALALVQAEAVRAALSLRYPERAFRIVHIRTEGDKVQSRSLVEIGGKGVFVKEIEEALSRQEVDLAVHSCKDLPTEQPAGLMLGAFPVRADPRDVLVSKPGCRLAGLPAGARIGTGSLRRAAQLRALRPDLVLADIRGNVDTRLRKLDEGQYDAIVLAAAGLLRLGLEARVSEYFDPQVVLPAPGQGALALEVREDGAEVRALIGALDDPATRQAVGAERAFLRGLGGGCDVPIGAHAWRDGDQLVLRGMLATGEGRDPFYAEAREPAGGSATDPDALGEWLARSVLERAAAR
jgi:hydroxymethylbilane synthase